MSLSQPSSRQCSLTSLFIFDEFPKPTLFTKTNEKEWNKENSTAAIDTDAHILVSFTATIFRILFQSSLFAIKANIGIKCPSPLSVRL